jgi:tripartite-type tricarboxylate transporter receptor subunit TctC
MFDLRSWSRRLGIVAATALTTVAAMPLRAEPAVDFYKGRTINMVIGYSVGGGYDLYARLLARYMGRHIPGNPTILPQSMPGAGSLKAVSFLYSVAPKDGMTFGTFGRTMPLEPLLSGAKFDPRQLSWLGSITRDVSLCVTWETSPIKTWDDLMTKNARFGGQAAGSDPDVFASVLKHFFGSNLNLVTGYPGNNELALAMERGEIDGYCGLSWSSLVSRHADWIKDKKVNLIVQAAIEMEPQLADTPMLLAKTTDTKKIEALKMILAAQALARPFALPPDVPADRLAILRDAFDQTLTDPEFLAEAAQLGLDVHPMSWQEANTILDEIYTLPPDAISMAKQAVGY